MSDLSEGPPLGIDAVSEPAHGLPTAPDERTREERDAERQDFALWKKMATSPAFRSVYVSERENTRLTRQLDDALCERRDLQARVLELGPENSLYRQSIHDLKGNFTLAALLLTGGGILVSIAGAVVELCLKRIALIIGLALTIYTLFWIRPNPQAGGGSRG